MSNQMTKSIIKKLRDPKQITWADLHIAKVKGQSTIPRNISYQNKENGEIYVHLAGGVGWPGETAPGFAVVLAVIKGEDSIVFKAVDEVEEADVPRLMDKCVELREKWGYNEDSEIMHIWWGDYERFYIFTAEANARLQKVAEKGQEQGFYIAPPLEFDRPNCFEIYLRRIKSLTEGGRKRLSFGSCNMLRNHLQTLPMEVSKKKAEDFPAVAALGFVLHSLAVIKPWERDLSVVAHEMGGDIRELATIEQEHAIEHMERGGDPGFGDEDEGGYENFGVKNTIPGG